MNVFVLEIPSLSTDFPVFHQTVQQCFRKNARSQLTGQKIPCNFYILTPTPPPPLFWNYRGCSVRDRDYLVQISLYQTLPDSSSLRKNNASHRKKFENSVPYGSGLGHRLFQMSNNNYPSIPFMHNGVSFHFSVFLKKSQEGHVKNHVLFLQLINIRQKCSTQLFISNLDQHFIVFN